MVARIIRRVQEKLGLTRSEASVILFLCAGLVIGGGVKMLHLDESAARYDFSDSDSFFRQASSKIDSIIAAEEDTSRHDAGKENLPSPVNINTATVEELVALPGVGQVTARRIIEYREAHGSFRSAEELINVKGIGPAKLGKMKPYLKTE